VPDTRDLRQKAEAATEAAERDEWKALVEAHREEFLSDYREKFPNDSEEDAARCLADFEAEVRYDEKAGA
jgi:hypothetical protein